MPHLLLLNLTTQVNPEPYVLVTVDANNIIQQLNTYLTQRYNTPTHVELYTNGRELVSDYLRLGDVLEELKRRMVYPILGYVIGLSSVSTIGPPSTTTSSTTTSPTQSPTPSPIPVTPVVQGLSWDEPLSDQDKDRLESLLDILERWQLERVDTRGIPRVAGILRAWNQQAQITKLQNDEDFRIATIRNLYTVLGIASQEDVLSGLPMEIQLVIMGKLDIDSLTRLGATNRYFRQLIYSPDMLETKAKELGTTVTKEKDGQVLTPAEQWVELVKYHDENFYGPRCMRANKNANKCLQLAAQAGDLEGMSKMYAEMKETFRHDEISNNIRYLLIDALRRGQENVVGYIITNFDPAVLSAGPQYLNAAAQSGNIRLFNRMLGYDPWYTVKNVLLNAALSGSIPFFQEVYDRFIAMGQTPGQPTSRQVISALSELAQKGQIHMIKFLIDLPWLQPSFTPGVITEGLSAGVNHPIIRQLYLQYYNSRYITDTEVYNIIIHGDLELVNRVVADVALLWQEFRETDITGGGMWELGKLLTMVVNALGGTVDRPFAIWETVLYRFSYDDLRDLLHNNYTTRDLFFDIGHNGDLERIKLLLVRGLNDRTAIDDIYRGAASVGNEEIIDYMLSNPTTHGPWNTIFDPWDTIFNVAAANGHFHLTQRALENGARNTYSIDTTLPIKFLNSIPKTSIHIMNDYQRYIDLITKYPETWIKSVDDRAFIKLYVNRPQLFSKAYDHSELNILRSDYQHMLEYRASSHYNPSIYSRYTPQADQNVQDYIASKPTHADIVLYSIVSALQQSMVDGKLTLDQMIELVHYAEKSSPSFAHIINYIIYSTPSNAELSDTDTDRLLREFPSDITPNNGLIIAVANQSASWARYWLSHGATNIEEVLQNFYRPNVNGKTFTRQIFGLLLQHASMDSIKYHSILLSMVRSYHRGVVDVEDDNSELDQLIAWGLAKGFLTRNEMMDLHSNSYDLKVKRVIQKWIGKLAVPVDQNVSQIASSVSKPVIPVPPHLATMLRQGNISEYEYRILMQNKLERTALDYSQPYVNQTKRAADIQEINDLLTWGYKSEYFDIGILENLINLYASNRSYGRQLDPDVVNLLQQWKQYIESQTTSSSAVSSSAASSSAASSR